MNLCGRLEEVQVVYSPQMYDLIDFDKGVRMDYVWG